MDNETPAAANEPQAVNGPQALTQPQAVRPVMPSAAELYELIAEAAYYRAQKRGFTPGAEAEDWLHAENEVMERVRKQYATRNGAEDG